MLFNNGEESLGCESALGVPLHPFSRIAYCQRRQYLGRTVDQPPIEHLGIERLTEAAASGANRCCVFGHHGVLVTFRKQPRAHIGVDRFFVEPFNTRDSPPTVDSFGHFPYGPMTTARVTQRDDSEQGELVMRADRQQGRVILNASADTDKINRELDHLPIGSVFQQISSERREVASEFFHRASKERIQLIDIVYGWMFKKITVQNIECASITLLHRENELRVSRPRYVLPVGAAKPVPVDTVKSPPGERNFIFYNGRIIRELFVRQNQTPAGRVYATFNVRIDRGSIAPRAAERRGIE